MKVLDHYEIYIIEQEDLKYIVAIYCGIRRSIYAGGDSPFLVTKDIEKGTE